MTENARTVVRHDFKDGTGKPVIKVVFFCENEPEALAVIAAGQSVPKPAAFIPALSAGPAFDSPEAPPPNCDFISHAGEALAHEQHEAATDGDDCTSGACLITRGSD